MTAEVITLKPKQKAKPLDGDVYFCKRCDNQTFMVTAAGSIYCANCQSLINTIMALRIVEPA